MVETIYSKNPQDKPVHHPEPTCGYRKYIERCGNDLLGEVPDPSQYLSVSVGDELRWYKRCDECTTIETNRLLGLDN